LDAIEYLRNFKDKWFYCLWGVIPRPGSNWYWFYCLRYCGSNAILWSNRDHFSFGSNNYVL